MNKIKSPTTFQALVPIIFLVILLSINVSIFGLLIFIEDGRPIIFKQYRQGWDGKSIEIYKIRSLKNNNKNK